jgi:hypothetical protein
LSKERPQDILTIRPIEYKANPVLTVLGTADPTDIIYVDTHWVMTAQQYGINEMQVDLFQRHSDFEPGEENWVGTSAFQDKDDYWGQSLPLAVFYFALGREVRRFEQFCRGYSVIMPGGDIILPLILDANQLLESTPEDSPIRPMITDVQTYGLGRFRFIVAYILKKDSPEWTSFVKRHKEAIARRNHRY